MTNYMDKNVQVPNYSGVNIQIFNPAVNMPGIQHPENGEKLLPIQQAQQQVIQALPPTTQNFALPSNIDNQQTAPNPWATIPNGSVYTNNNQVNNNIQYPQQPQATYPQYPPYPYPMPYGAYPMYPPQQQEIPQEDTKTKPLTEKKKVVVLTDEYIRSLENYLNNPNREVRLQAANDIVHRFEEDPARFDDPALNALMNKMLQDPQPAIRNVALGLVSGGVAQGNDFTVQLLNTIKENKINKQEALFATEALLRLATKTDTIEVPVEKVKTNGNNS